MKKTLFIFSLFLTSIIVFANDSKLSNFSRAFIDVRKDLPTAQHDNLRKRFALKVANNKDYVKAYVYFVNDIDENVLNNYGATLDVTIDKTLCTATIPADELEALSDNPAISFIEIGQPVRQRMDKARVAAEVDKVQAGTSLSQPFLGTNVIIGVIDGGFQYNHINFYDMNDPTELRVKNVWNISANKKYTTQATIEAAQYDNANDESGHATHVSGIAAGSYGFGTSTKYYGVAPDADIVMVEYGSTNADITSGIDYIFDYASQVNKPAVINLSLGVHTGPHDGTSTFDRALDAMVGKGRIVVGAAGNEGEYPIYKEVTLAANQTAIFTIDDSDSYYDGNGFADFWGDEGQTYTVEAVYMDASNNIKATGTATKVATTSNVLTTWTNTNYASGSLKAYTTLSSNAVNNKGNVYVYFNGMKPVGTYKVGFRVTAKTAGTIRVWGDDYSSIYWEGGQTTHTVGEIGGTAKGIISVGAISTRKTSSYPYTVNSIAGFSSKGPTADGRLKPEIIAPGAAIRSSIPNTSTVLEGADTKTSETIGGTTYYWAYMGGTSMATPFVTGVIATWLQANPQLSPDDIRNVFASTSTSDSYTGVCPNNTAGYGKINAHAGLLNVIQTTPIKNLETMPDAIMAYPNPNNGSFKLLFTEADEDLLVSVYTMNGQKIVSQHINQVAVQENLDIDLGHVDTGAYIVKVAGKKINETFRLLVR